MQPCQARGKRAVLGLHGEGQSGLCRGLHADAQQQQQQQQQRLREERTPALAPAGALGTALRSLSVEAGAALLCSATSSTFSSALL